MRELLRQKRPWQVWVMLGDLAITAVVCTVILAPRIMQDINQMWHFSTLNALARFAMFGLITLAPAAFYLLLHARKWGKYLYAVFAFLCGGLSVLGIFRLYLIVCVPSSLYFASGEAVADEARRARGRAWYTPGKFWGILWVWLLVLPKFPSGFNLLCAYMPIYGEHWYFGQILREIFSGTAPYFIWFLLLWAAVLPRRSLRDFVTRRVILALMLGSVLAHVDRKVYVVLWEYFSDADMLQSRLSALAFSVRGTCFLLFVMFFWWCFCIRRSWPPLAYFKDRRCSLLLAAGTLTSMLPCIIMTGYPEVKLALPHEGILWFNFVETGGTCYETPRFIAAYAGVFAALLLWYSFRRYENKAAAPRGDT